MPEAIERVSKWPDPIGTVAVAWGKYTELLLLLPLHEGTWLLVTDRKATLDRAGVTDHILQTSARQGRVIGVGMIRGVRTIQLSATTFCSQTALNPSEIPPVDLDGFLDSVGVGQVAVIVDAAGTNVAALHNLPGGWLSTTNGRLIGDQHAMQIFASRAGETYVRPGSFPLVEP